MVSQHAIYMRGWYAKNKDRINAQRRADGRWRRPSERESRRISSYVSQSNRRASEAECDDRLTSADIRSISGPCHYCGGEALGWDHVVPLSRGGRNIPSNIVPCCIKCNRAKWHRTAEEFAAGVMPPQSPLAGAYAREAVKE